MHVIAIGRLRDSPEAALFERYSIRLRPRLSVTELPEGRGNPTEVKRREGAALIAALPRQCFAVALDLGGAVLDSEALSICLSSGRGLGVRSVSSLAARRGSTHRSSPAPISFCHLAR